MSEQKASEPTPNEKMVAALRRERAALQSQGKDERVAQVDEQLKFYGDNESSGKSDDSKKPETRKQAPQGRSTRPQQTTD